MGQKSGGEEVPIRGCWAAQSIPEYKCCPFIQTRQQQQNCAGSGTPALPCHSQEGSRHRGQLWSGVILATQLPTSKGGNCTTQLVACLHFFSVFT